MARLICEIAGPERAPFNQVVARYLRAVDDPREVVCDGEARLGRIGLDKWLRRSRG